MRVILFLALRDCPQYGDAGECDEMHTAQFDTPNPSRDRIPMGHDGARRWMNCIS
jgi:hypothetical protein